MSKNFKMIGEEVWKNKVERVNLEFFIFTYGAFVVQLIQDYEDYEQVNKQLEKMGYNIGTRIIDDFLARTNLTKCVDFKETMNVICSVGFKMYMNCVPQLTNFSTDNKSCSIVLDENPLNEYVELTQEALNGGLWYSNVIIGVLKGALEMIQMQIEAEFITDVLRGDETTEIKVTLVRMIDEEVPPSEG